jgi:predicted amidohydrolase
LILLPEGVPVVGTGKTYIDVAEPLSGSVVKKLEKLARQHGAWVVAGVYEKDGVVVYNTSVLIDRSGKLQGKYRKVYLPREELEAGITPGNEFPVFETDFGKVGMMICWDSQYADPARALALRGAELILMPIWGGNETLIRARAIENHVFVASSGYDYPSAVVDPSGKELVRSETDGTIALTTIDLNQRYVDKWLGNMRGRFYRELRSDVKVNPYQK